MGHRGAGRVSCPPHHCSPVWWMSLGRVPRDFQAHGDMKSRLTTFSWLYYYFLILYRNVCRTNHFHSIAILSPFIASAGFSHRFQKFTRRVSHKAPPSSCTKNSSHRPANFSAVWGELRNLMSSCLQEIAERIGYYFLGRRLSTISDRKEFNQEVFHQGQQSPNEAFCQ